MREIFEFVKSMYDNYNGTGMHMALFFAAVLYLLVQKKDEKRYVFLGYTLLFFIICFFPLTAKIIIACIGKTVYWRMFWLLPTAIITAYAGVQVIMAAEKKMRRYFLLFVMVLVIMMTGTRVYNASMFEYKQNHYNIPQDVVNICDIIEEDAKAKGITEKKLVVTNELLPFIRQYDGEIKMPYGNNAVRGETIKSNNASEIFRIMCAEHQNWDVLSFYAAMEGCNYLAYPVNEDVEKAAEKNGYEKIGSNGAYDVYRQTREKEAWDGQWLLTQHGGAQGSQLMFYTLTDNKGHVIVVDGGWRSDADYVRKQLKALGNHVDAWFVTHPHRDHAGAFYEIYKEPGKLEIDKVYMVDMAPVDLCLSNAPWDEVEVYEKLLTLDMKELSYVHPGDTLDIEGLQIQIFNAYEDYVDEMSDDLLNDGSMLFKATAGEESVLFCSDVGKGMSDYLLDTYGDKLKADYVQMGHHGNGGLKRDFYEKVGAKAAFFDAPDWLMNDRSGHYKTLKNTAMMAELGADIYSFSTTPNQILIK